MQEIKIDSEFKALIPPLTKEEFEQLEKNCLQDGIMQALIVWDNILIDGHNRYEIAQRYDLPFEVIEKDFADRYEAKEWIITHQLGRRNVTEEQKSYLRGKRYENEKLKSGTRTDLVQQLHKVEQTDKKLAKEYNVSERTINNDADFARGIDVLSKVSDDLKRDILQGKSDISKKEVQEIAKETKQVEKEVRQNSFLQTDTDIQAEIDRKAKIKAEEMLKAWEEEKDRKKQERLANIERQKEEIITQNLSNQYSGLYDVIAIDPPWAYEEVGGFTANQHDSKSNRGGVDYPTMTVEEISNIPIPIKDNSVVFLWTTQKFLPHAFEILKKWGLEYKNTIVWDKVAMGLGRTLRIQCEFCLVGFKGKPIFEGSATRDIIQEQRREHSRKPIAFYDLVEKVTTGRRLEYFSREAREGWDIFGNDINKF